MTRERKRSRYEMALLSENFKFFRRFPVVINPKNVTACLVPNNSLWLWRPEWSLLVSCFKMMLTMTDVVCGVHFKAVVDRGEGPGVPPHLIFRPKWGPKGPKNFFLRLSSPSPYLKVWIRHCKGHNTTDEKIRKLLYFITYSGSLTYKMSSSKMWAIYKSTVAMTISLEEAYFSHETGVKSMLVRTSIQLCCLNLRLNHTVKSFPIFHATKAEIPWSWNL